MTEDLSQNYGYFEESTRRRFLSVSTATVVTGLAGCSENGIGGSGSELSAPDQTALEIYSTSYEATQEAKEKYDSGIETFRDNVGADGTLENYPSDWPDLQEKMADATSLFADGRDGFHQARRAASSSAIESACKDAVEWIEPHTTVSDFFRHSGGPPVHFVDEHEDKISQLTEPMSPDELEAEVRG